MMLLRCIDAMMLLSMMTYLIYSVSFNIDVTKVADVEQENEMTKIAIMSQKLLRDVIII